MTVIVQGRLLVGLFVAGWLALQPTTGHAQAAPGLTMTANPASAQLVYPTNSTQSVVTANLPPNWQGNSWSATNPQYGTVVLGEDCSPASPTCTVTYTQQATPTYGRADPFVVTLTGVANTVVTSGSVTVTVTSYPAAPTASNFTVQDANGGPVSVDLDASGYITHNGVPASGVTIAVVTPPAHGTATVAGTTVTYQPGATFSGSDTIGYQVSDGALTSASGSMTIAVQAVNVSIPSDVVGQTQAAGSTELAAAGFAVTVVEQYSATVPSGRIVTTQPAPGTSAPRGSAVKLLVSRGPGAASSEPLSSIPGLTSQQVSVARGLEKTCSVLADAYNTGTSLTAKQQDLLTTCSAIVSDYEDGTDVPGLQQTLNAISGRQATATVRTPMQFAAGQISNIGARLDALRGGERGFSFSGLSFGPPGGAQSAFAPLIGLTRDILGGGAGDGQDSLLGDRLGVFVTGTLRRGSERTTDAEEGFDLKDTGVTAGVDYRLGESYVLGLAVGYGKSETSFDDSSGSLDAKHTSVSLYGSYSRDLYHIDWLAGFGHHSYDLSRDIHFASSSTGVGCGNGSCSIGTQGSTGAREYTFSTGGGLDFHRDAFAFGPTVELEYKQVGVSAFTESGPSGLDLDFAGLTSSSLLMKTGGYVSYAVNTRWFVVLPQIRARFIHEFLNASRSEQVQFAADTLPGASDRAFYVFTDSPDRTYFDWRASVLVQFRYGIAGFIDYGGISGLRNINAHELNIGIRLQTALR